MPMTPPASDADLQETNQDLELIELIGMQNWLVQKLNRLLPPAPRPPYRNQKAPRF